MAWDATIYHTCAPTYLLVTAATSHAAAELAEEKKARKYASIKHRVDLSTVGLETIGVFGPSARDIFGDIARRIRDRSVFAGFKA